MAIGFGCRPTVSESPFADRSLHRTVDEFQRELIVEGTNEGLAAVRARGRAGGRKPSLTPGQIDHARKPYADGEHTVAQIAGLLGVSRPAIYRALEPEAVAAPAAG